jgi:hypothetical protein
MKPTHAALTFTALSVIWGPTASAIAGDARVAKGTITAIGGQSLTVKVGEQDMAFKVDTTTVVRARGASTKATRFAATGKPGPHLADVLHPGQAVAVTYSDMAGNLRASEIKAIPKAPGADANADLRSTGIVKAIGADWMTINGKIGGGGTFEQTFKLDPKTMVSAKGAGTAVAAKGGKAPFSDLVSSGDHVTVSYHKHGTSLLASDVHVTLKASH